MYGLNAEITEVTHEGDVSRRFMFHDCMEPGMMLYACIPRLRRPRQENCCVFEVNLGYIVSCRLTWVTKGDHVSTKTRNNTLAKECIVQMQKALKWLTRSMSLLSPFKMMVLGVILWSQHLRGWDTRNTLDLRTVREPEKTLFKKKKERLSCFLGLYALCSA